jgi:hypothetical protein
VSNVSSVPLLNRLRNGTPVLIFHFPAERRG